ncbi:MAG: S-layer homology domain-containing protein, partial [Bacillota bacterium]|nr:S-layer homology domain-containing protein [Bacillota bacterium]
LKFGKSMNDFRKDVRRIVMNKIKFNDISGNWAEKHIQKLADYGVVNGVQNDDGTYSFRPDEPITRAEAAVMIANALSVVGK